MACFFRELLIRPPIRRGGMCSRPTISQPKVLCVGGCRRPIRLKKNRATQTFLSRGTWVRRCRLETSSLCSWRRKKKFGWTFWNQRPAVWCGRSHSSNSTRLAPSTMLRVGLAEWPASLHRLPMECWYARPAKVRWWRWIWPLGHCCGPTTIPSRSFRTGPTVWLLETSDFKGRGG